MYADYAEKSGFRRWKIVSNLFDAFSAKSMESAQPAYKVFPNLLEIIPRARISPAED